MTGEPLSNWTADEQQEASWSMKLPRTRYLRPDTLRDRCSLVLEHRNCLYGGHRYSENRSDRTAKNVFAPCGYLTCPRCCRGRLTNDHLYRILLAFEGRPLWRCDFTGEEWAASAGNARTLRGSTTKHNRAVVFLSDGAVRVFVAAEAPPVPADPVFEPGIEILNALLDTAAKLEAQHGNRRWTLPPKPSALKEIEEARKSASHDLRRVKLPRSVSLARAVRSRTSALHREVVPEILAPGAGITSGIRTGDHTDEEFDLMHADQVKLAETAAELDAAVSRCVSVWEEKRGVVDKPPATLGSAA